MAIKTSQISLFPESIQKQIKEQLERTQGMTITSRKQPSGVDSASRHTQGHVDVFDVVLPIYWTIVKKKKEDKAVLIGMNAYRNMHFVEQNNMKKYIASVAKLQFPFRDTRWEKFSVDYELYYKNAVSDPMNIISCVDKFLIDALVDCQIVAKDTVKHYCSGAWRVAGQDKEHSRIRATVRRT